MPAHPADDTGAPARTVLVVGATGNQGGAVVDQLLGADESFAVRGLTRRPDSSAARALADRGVEVVRGDLGVPASLASAVEGVDAAFVVTNYWTAGAEAQRRQCENVADALAAADVDHVVFSGAGYHDRDLGFRSMAAPAAAERYMRELGLPLTVLRPVWFMHNLEPVAQEILEGTLALPISTDVGLQMLAVRDVGRVTLAALREPDRFVGESFDLAGDERTLAEMAETLSWVVGDAVEPRTVPTDVAREELGDQMADLWAWFDRGGYQVDVDALEDRIGVRLTKFEQYLVANGWEDKAEPARLPGIVKARTGEGAP